MANPKPSEPNFKVVVEKDQAMRTRDGVTLRADVYRPDASGRFPVLLVRTPYDKGAEMALTEKDYFPPRGYAVVVQDTRGRHSSEGEFYPFIHEAHDGYDAVEWAAALPWSNGKVGMVGQSYLALVQHYAAVMRPPHLRVAAPVSAPVTRFENFVYRRGALELGWLLAYFMFMARDTLARKGLYEQHRARLDSYVSRPDIPMAPLKRDAFHHLPVRDWGERLKDGAPFFADYLRHSMDGPYWAANDLRPRFGEFDTPMFHVGSWYDAFQYDTLAMYRGIRDGARTPQTRRAQKLMMAPGLICSPIRSPPHAVPEISTSAPKRQSNCTRSSCDGSITFSRTGKTGCSKSRQCGCS